MFKVDNKDTRTTSFDVVYIPSFITLEHIANFEHLILLFEIVEISAQS